MARHAYKSTPLFGGAIVVDMPEKFVDVSKIRTVPDNQEVYLDNDGFTSIIVDILERIETEGDSPLERDGKAMTAHLEDIAGEDAENVRVWNTTETRFTHLDPSIPCYTLIATTIPKPKQPLIPENMPPELAQQQIEAAKRSAPDFTALIMTLVRLEQKQTDIIITINVPHIKGEYDEEEVDLELGKQGKLIGDAVEYAARVWETFEIKDWGLFA